MSKAITNMKQDCNLFNQLLSSSQVCFVDMDVFFKYENVQYPPSLSDNGEFVKHCWTLGHYYAKIVDGATLVDIIPTTQWKTCYGYAENVSKSRI